jgi:predicted phosphodiesterase
VTETIRAVGVSDLHFGKPKSDAKSGAKVAYWRDKVSEFSERAHILFVAGDWTQDAKREEAEQAADAFRDSPIPVVGVLGNHDRPADNPGLIKQILEDRGGIKILQGDVFVYERDGFSVQVTGDTGYNHLYSPGKLGPHKVPEDTYLRMIDESVEALELGVNKLHGDQNIVLLHYAHVHKPDDNHQAWRIPPRKMMTIDKLIARNRRRIDFVMHGDIHSEPNPQTKVHGIPVFNIASQPISIEMSADIPVIVNLR